MQVHFESHDAEALALRGVAVRQVRFAMRRLAWLVPRAHVRLTDVNGPRGGVDKRCRVELRAPGSGTVVVTSIARDWRSALQDAVSRAVRAMRRAWQRARDRARSAPAIEAL